MDAVGPHVSDFHVGDAVVGVMGPRLGAHAGYVCLPATGALARQPTNLTLAEAIAAGDGGLTALPFLRDEARLRGGQAILVNGASGSVGSAAVQLAKRKRGSVILTPNGGPAQP